MADYINANAVAIFWGSCALLTLLLAVVTHRQTGWHQTIMAACMVGVWLGSKIIRAQAGPGAMLMAYPFEDALVGLVALTLYVRRPETWKLMVAFVMLVRLACHLVNHPLVVASQQKWVAGLDDYILTCNLLFGLALLCVAQRGGIVVGLAVARSFVSYPRRHAVSVPFFRRGVAAARKAAWP